MYIVLYFQSQVEIYADWTREIRSSFLVKSRKLCLMCAFICFGVFWTMWWSSTAEREAKLGGGILRSFEALRRFFFFFLFLLATKFVARQKKTNFVSVHHRLVVRRKGFLWTSSAKWVFLFSPRCIVLKTGFSIFYFIAAVNVHSCTSQEATRRFS